jgi:ABC-type phosphate transport system permease subunit
MNITFFKRLKHQIGRKLNSTSGESFVETLAAVIISVLAMMILTGAIVTSARVNHQTENTETTFTTKTQKSTTDEITIKEGTTSTTLPVTVYTTENGYIYYQLQE